MNDIQENPLIQDDVVNDDTDEVVEGEDESPAPIYDNDDEGEEEEEEECRVCRGPREEGRPLFAPCKCSGSIGLVHQDCLMSWLEVTRGDGRCELCKTKFQFDPQYAENTPDTLPAYEVIMGLSSRALAKWIPLGFRICIAASLWLLVAPLLTTFLYHGWMHRPSSILARWQTSLVASDIVSGAIIAAIVIISFLSLMSFADFLRVHWAQQPQPQQRGAGEGNNNNNNQPFARRNNNRDGGMNDEPPTVNDDDGGIDEVVVETREAVLKELDRNVKKINADGRTSSTTSNADQNLKNQCDDDKEESNHQQPERANNDDNNGGTNSIFERLVDQVQEVNMNDLHIDGLRVGGTNNNDNDDEVHSQQGSDILNDAIAPNPMHPRDEDEANNFIDNDDDDDEVEDHNDEGPDVPNEVNNNNDGPMFPGLDNNDINDRPFDPMDPGLPDDQVDMEINVALDELLGLRGPLSTLVRNLLWLLAFNATYLGIFAFLPKTVGSAVYTGILNTTTCDTILKTVPFMYSEDEERLTFLGVINSLNEESSRLNTTFRLPDVATVTLGYFSMAAIIVIMRYFWNFVHFIRQKVSGGTQDTNPGGDGQAPRIRRGQHHRQDQPANAVNDPAGVDENEGTAVGAVLDATVAVVKVGMLLFLKMFLLPLLLGLWLDASTTNLFGHTISDRIAFAGGDLFSFVLLHWVAGITFMLLVTVFLLQLREVTHPELLARMIRPQEPQPDLLGNLMHETVATHMKRMFLSLGIYAPLLTMHVTLPVKLFMASGLGARFPFFQLHFWHVLMPKMQIPLELIVFHLSMLALLERYKNSIGGLQHRWMVFMCRRMGLTEYMMPRTVEKFKYIGQKEILSTSGDIDPFWYELAGSTKDLRHYIHSNIQKTEEDRFEEGSSKENGQRILTESLDFIRLPAPRDSDCVKDDDNKRLLPTKLGKFRLKVVKGPNTSQLIEVWEEIPGEEIVRPPAGWDDLGAGGAFVQGRWAWGNERKSKVEWSVASRTPFKTLNTHRRPPRLMLKVIALVVLSWLAITLTVLCMFSVPLAAGRSLYYLFRVPQYYIHDPLAFTIGGCLVFPMISLTYNRFGNGQESPLKRFHTSLSRLHAPPTKKLLVVIESLVLWIMIAPMALGAAYEVAVVKSRAWFSREEPFIDFKSLLFCWFLGTVVLHTWAFLAYFSVFTKTFWSNIGNGILEPPLDENVGGGRVNMDVRNENDGEADRDGTEFQYQPWQGKRGRVARFFNVWFSVFANWDWDTVDRTILVEEFARPITKQVASALVGSSLTYQFSLFAVPLFSEFVEGGVSVRFIGVLERGLLKMLLFRVCLAVHIFVQLSSASRARLEMWFQAAHDAARDDRYLIGEILMNYETNTSG